LKQRAIPKILIILILSASSVFLLPPSLNPAKVHAQSVRLEVWNPDVRSSNITGPQFQFTGPPGPQLSVRVNLTDPQPILAFDVSLNYNITVGPNPLQLVDNPSIGPLSGGLIDPATSYPPAPDGTPCSAVSVKSDLDSPAGGIRIAASMTGGCTVPGTGVLFTLTFNVVGSGATSIDISQTVKPQTTIVEGVGFPPAATTVPYQAFSAYFWNVAGTPPVPTFTYEPAHPLQGDQVQFNATQSFDPENPLAPNNGIQIEPIVYDTNNNQVYDSGEPVIVGATPAVGTPLGSPPPQPDCRFGCFFNKPDPHVAFNDTNGNHIWDPGETIAYDSSLDHKFDSGDFVITGATVPANAILSGDSLLTFVDTHANNFWDNGYLWLWGDGSTIVSTGNVTSHVFQSSPTVSSSGLFSVKLVVFDSDTSLPNRLVQVVRVGPNIVFDVSVFLELSKPILNVGEKLGVTVTLSNRGNQHIDVAHMNVSYDLNTLTSIDQLRGISLITYGAHEQFNYTIDTSSLSPRTYTVTAQAVIVNATTQEIIPNFSSDNVRSQSFLLQGSQAPGISLPILIAAGVGALIAVWAVVYVIRRRRPAET